MRAISTDPGSCHVVGQRLPLVDERALLPPFFLPSGRLGASQVDQILAIIFMVSSPGPVAGKDQTHKLGGARRTIRLVHALDRLDSRVAESAAMAQVACEHIFGLTTTKTQ